MAGLARLIAKKIRNDPTPEIRRLTKYQNLLFGGASSDSVKICFLQRGQSNMAAAPAAVPTVNTT